MQDLFGNDISPGDLLSGKKGVRKSEEAYRLLVQLYGRSEGNKCGRCKYFYFKVLSKKYPKCQLANLQGSTTAVDWSSRWLACGKFEPEKEHI
jgi:hypothetical protein